MKQKESKNKLLVYYSPVAIPEAEWPAENAPLQLQLRPTLPDWIDANFTKCILNLFPDRNANNFDTVEECFDGTDRNDLDEALNCAYCGFDEDNRDFVYAFCNATGTLQEEQVLTCEDYDQLKSSKPAKSLVSLSEGNTAEKIDISWTTGNHQSIDSINITIFSNCYDRRGYERRRSRNYPRKL